MPSLLFVGAHPDDDAMGVARTIALHAADADLRFVLVIATDGEAGDIAPESGATRDALGAVRRRETVDSWDAIGRQPDRYEWLAMADGGLADHSFADLVDRIATVLDEERPDVVATFGPDGISGHSDHRTVSAATKEAFHLVRGDGRGGLHRLVYAAIPQSWVDRWNERRRNKGQWVWDPKVPFHLRGVPDETIGIDVDTAQVADRVISAIRRHVTQWSYSTMDDDRALRESLQREHWVIAWPPTPPGSPPLADIFEAL